MVNENYCGNMIVHSISGDGMVILRKTNQLPTGEFSIETINPIIIKEDILYNMSFLIRTHPFSMEYKKGSFTIEYITNDRIYFVRFCGTLYPVNYVHQLQNLYFALTGNELEFLL
jgi:hypothetical protein